MRFDDVEVGNGPGKEESLFLSIFLCIWLLLLFMFLL